MAFKAILFVTVWFFSAFCGGANVTCSESVCKLSIMNKDLSMEFRSKSSAHGVRMIYLHLNISNESYNPLQSFDKFLPNRWTWARDIGEPMLSFSYQYQVLSLGLLRNQVRNIKVEMNEEPSGCLAELTASCKDITVARTLLDQVINPSDSTSHMANVVCVSVVQRDMDWPTALYYGNVGYQCCDKEKRGNETVVQCNLPVEYSDWLRVFYHELTFGVIAAFLLWPAAFVLLPDFLFKFDDEQERKNRDISEKSSANASQNNSNKETTTNIPVDDESPITLWIFVNKCSEKCPKTSNLFKLVILCYVFTPILGYIFFALNYLFLLDFLKEIEAKYAIQENVFFHYVFDIRTKPYCLIPVIIFFVIPSEFIYYLACSSACVRITEVRSELQKNLQELPNQISKLLLYDRKRKLSKFGVFFGPHRVTEDAIEYLKEHKILYYSLSSVAIFCYILMLTFCALYGVLLGIVMLFCFLVKSAVITIRLSPFVVLVQFTEKLIKKALPRYFFMPFWIGWVCYFSLAVSMCCRFYVRMCGFVLMGIIINAQKATPYVIFIYVLIKNITTSYKSFQKRFMDVKNIIFQHYQKPGQKILKTIPEDLFWFVCNKKAILPLQREICIMLVSIFIISSTLFLALATIVFFGEEYGSSPLVSAAAVLLSGKIPDIMLKGLIKRETFKGWEKIRKEEEVRKAVDEYNSYMKDNVCVTEGKKTCSSVFLIESLV